jgi:Ca2+-binding EF-hand superfamily protein
MFPSVTFEFVEKVRQSFSLADTDHTGYLDMNNFTVFMQRTYPNMSDREAQIIFLKVEKNHLAIDCCSSIDFHVLALFIILLFSVCFVL